MKKEFAKRFLLLAGMIGVALAVSIVMRIIQPNITHIPATTTTDSSSISESVSHDDARLAAKKAYELSEREKEKELEEAMKAYAEKEATENKKKELQYMYGERYQEIALAEKLELDEPKDDSNSSSNETSNKWFYSITSADYTNLVMAIQHETGNDPSFYVNGDFDLVQQYMAKSLLNRLGKPGFGFNYGTAYTVYDLLSNQVQYGNMLTEMWAFDPDDERTKKNLDKVLSGQDNLPNDLYYERCSTIGASYAEAIEEFLYNYPDCKSMEVVYMSLTNEGRYIIFARNPFGAYAG